MTATELCQRFGISLDTLHNWTTRNQIPKPIGKYKGARYGLAHIEAIEAIFRLRHHNVSIPEAVSYCHEVGISLPQYVSIREEATRAFGIGVA